jgi:hypothetical protein
MSATHGPAESGISNTIHTMTDSISVAWPVSRHNLPDDRHVPLLAIAIAGPPLMAALTPMRYALRLTEDPNSG